MKVWGDISTFVQEQGTACLITVLSAKGSAPRDAGTRLVVAPNKSFTGTIGGGTLEWEAIKNAARLLDKQDDLYEQKTYPLGPQLGQCCGGSVTLLFETFTPGRTDEIHALLKREQVGAFKTRSKLNGARVHREISTTPHPENFDWDGACGIKEVFGVKPTTLYLFGAGHVGKALMLALAPLPFQVSWFDSRPDAFPVAVPSNFTCHQMDDLPGILKTAPDDSFIVALTHSHDIDLAIMHQALQARDFPFVGVIGSTTKASRFKSKLRSLGVGDADIARMRCPIGYGGIKSKEPAAIALSIATELLEKHEGVYG